MASQQGQATVRAAQDYYREWYKGRKGGGQRQARAVDETEVDRMEKLEEDSFRWVAAAEAGLAADLVMVLDDEMAPETAQEIDQALTKLEDADVRVVMRDSPSTGHVMVLLTAFDQDRLESEAEKRKVSMKLAPTAADFKQRPKAQDFQRVLRLKFALKNGGLFSPLERQRLMCAIAEGAHFRGGAQLDLDDMVGRGVMRACFPLHTAERKAVAAAWLGIRLGVSNGWPNGWPYEESYAAAAGRWPLRRDDNREPRRIFPDLGMSQQPLDAIRSYFGAKIAFYFAWAEAYTLWLLTLMWPAICLQFVGLTAGHSKAAYSCILVIGVAAFNNYWAMTRAGLAYTWDVVD